MKQYIVLDHREFDVPETWPADTPQDLFAATERMVQLEIDRAKVFVGESPDAVWTGLYLCPSGVPWTGDAN